MEAPNTYAVLSGIIRDNEEILETLGLFRSSWNGKWPDYPQEKEALEVLREAMSAYDLEVVQDWPQRYRQGGMHVMFYDRACNMVGVVNIDPRILEIEVRRMVWPYEHTRYALVYGVSREAVGEYQVETLDYLTTTAWKHPDPEGIKEIVWSAFADRCINSREQLEAWMSRYTGGFRIELCDYPPHRETMIIVVPPETVRAVGEKQLAFVENEILSTYR